ncbi:META domain-containing protein [Amaricoccus sp.]|uniref:META domain-containing protein n=1 Tax=Amaricoccus sp. TaxID=1872485 RepID=UPI001B4E129C|nr:META domain-containing protein [Amaricoccus sp.]MBP7001973.1 META domain-containing protein [Amaricoccus sp.]
MRRALALALVVAACAPMAPDEPAGGPAGWILPGSEWRLVELNGKPYPARLTATLTEDGRIVGQGPCNRFTAGYEGRWPDLTFQPMATTRMACPDLEAETAAFAALAAVTHGDNGPEGLILTGPGDVRLRFEPAV